MQCFFGAWFVFETFPKENSGKASFSLYMNKVENHHMVSKNCNRNEKKRKEVYADFFNNL